jgi:hypothetical protein
MVAGHLRRWEVARSTKAASPTTLKFIGQVDLAEGCYIDTKFVHSSPHDLQRNWQFHFTGPFHRSLAIFCPRTSEPPWWIPWRPFAGKKCTYFICTHLTEVCPSNTLYGRSTTSITRVICTRFFPHCIFCPQHALANNLAWAITTPGRFAVIYTYVEIPFILPRRLLKLWASWNKITGSGLRYIKANITQ